MSCEHDCDRPARFPDVPWNRPGLKHFNYRIGNYATMREHMLDQLVKAPMLAGWTHLASDEPGIALLEGSALIGDILTFYQELYGNETKLVSSDWDESIFDLVQLTGYRPAPGIGGYTRFALDVKARTIVPVSFAFQAQLEGIDKPSVFESTAAIDAFPAFGSFHLYRRRHGLQAIVGATSLDIARRGGKDDLLSRQNHSLETGDRLLILSSPLAAHEILVVKDTAVHLDRVTIHFEGAIQNEYPGEVTAFKIGRTFRHFGADAPVSFSTFKENPPKTIHHDTQFSRRTSSSTPSTEHYSTIFRRQMPLASEVDDLAVGTRVVCVGQVTQPVKRDFTFIRRIEKITPRAVLWAGVTSPTSMLTLSDDLRTNTLSANSLGFGNLSNTSIVGSSVAFLPNIGFDIGRAAALGGIDLTATGIVSDLPNTVFDEFDIAVNEAGIEEQDIRRLRIYETLSEKLILRAPSLQKREVIDGRMHYFGTRDEAEALAGRRLLLAGGTNTVQDIVVSEQQPELMVSSGPAGDQRMWPIQLGVMPLASADGFDEVTPTVTVYGNVIDVDEGESQAEVVIGSGDSRLIFQTFPIPESPLTFHTDSAASPPFTAELEIRVDGRLWEPVVTFFDQPADAEIYVIRQIDKSDYVQFGDGINGAKLSSGRNNVEGIFRVGSGSWGELAVDAQPKPKGNLKTLREVHMPGPVTGGAPPEPMSVARAAAPGRMQSLGRLVGISDYEAEALAVPGVLKAGAVFSAQSEQPAILLTVLTEDESPEAIAAVAEVLRHADRCRGPTRYPLEVVAGRRRFVQLSMTLGYDPAYRIADITTAVTKALGGFSELDEEPSLNGLFSLDQRRFGQDTHISQAVAQAQSVDGVLWVRPSAFGKLPATTDNPADIRIPDRPVLTPRITIANVEVLALHVSHLTILTSSVANDEECLP